MMPQDCPDEIVDYHYTLVRSKLIERVKKTKNKLITILKIKKK